MTSNELAVAVETAMDFFEVTGVIGTFFTIAPIANDEVATFAPSRVHATAAVEIAGQALLANWYTNLILVKVISDWKATQRVPKFKLSTVPLARITSAFKLT